jgi:topoisomerase-4 subunit A
LSYRAGDQFKRQARGRSHQPLILLDSTGQSYSLAVQQLPSARTQGEPLSGHLAPAAGAHFVGLFLADEEEMVLCYSKQGYGFLTAAKNLLCKNKKGKAMLNVGDGEAGTPLLCADVTNSYLALVNDEGYLLIIPVKDIPTLPKGKGVKLMQIGKQKNSALKHAVLLRKEQSLKIFIGKREFSLSPRDWQAYQGERARRGKQLPKAFLHVQALEAV